MWGSAPPAPVQSALRSPRARTPTTTQAHPQPELEQERQPLGHRTKISYGAARNFHSRGTWTVSPAPSLSDLPQVDLE